MKCVAIDLRDGAVVMLSPGSGSPGSTTCVPHAQRG